MPCFFIFLSLLLSFSAYGAAYKPILNVLAPLGLFSQKLIAQFEEEGTAHVRIEFVGSRFEYETRLRSGLRNYDVVVADERVLQKLFLQRQLRSFENDGIIKKQNPSHLEVYSKLNFEAKAYVPLLVDPMGIAYNKKNFMLKKNQASWEWLISIKENPFWRQKIFVSNSPKHQLLLALLATGKEISSSSWQIPDTTLKWLQKLKLQSAQIDFPLELAFLGNKIEAAVVLRSKYLKLKKIVTNLKFAVPLNVTFYDRIAVAVVSDTVQDTLAQNFIKFLYQKKDQLITNDNFLSLNTKVFEGSYTKNWVFYDDDNPLPRRIENILNELYKK